MLDGPRATIGRSKSAECVLRDPNVSRRHAELRRAESGDWQIVDLGSTNGVKVNGRRVPSTRLSPGDEVTRGHHDLPLRHRAVAAAGRSVPRRVAYDPISVALKFGFLAVLFLFLLFIARSAMKDLRGTVAPAPDATGFHPAQGFGASLREAPTPGWSSSAAAASSRASAST